MCGGPAAAWDGLSKELDAALSGRYLWGRYLMLE